MLRQPGKWRLTNSVRVHLRFSLNFSVRIIQALVATDVSDYFYLLMRHQGGRRELSTARAQARDSCSCPCRPMVALHRGRRCCGNFRQPSVARRLTATSRKVALREAPRCGGWLAQQRPAREASPHGGPGLRRSGTASNVQNIKRNWDVSFSWGTH
nr:uncharacterized protein LOC127296100 isoform X2 [Lolium perenne]